MRLVAINTKTLRLPIKLVLGLAALTGVSMARATNLSRRSNSETEISNRCADPANKLGSNRFKLLKAGSLKPYFNL